MFLTGPQSRHFRPEKFEGLSRRGNHFDWELFYRFKDDRERFWLKQVETNPSFKRLVETHFARFQESINTTIRYLEATQEPLVLDVGLSSEPLDRALMMRLDAKVLVLDVQEEAGATYESVFGSKGSFVLGDVITYSADRANTERFDLVFSFGLIEHFPDKRDILDAHIELAKPGGIVLLYVPIDSPDNRELTAMAAEWENFGYRELLTVDELAEVCADPRLDVLAAEPVGFFSAVWARRKTT